MVRTNIHHTIQKLRTKKYVTNKEYGVLYRNCKRVSAKMYCVYKLSNIVYNPSLREEIIEDITAVALTKAIKGYDPSKKAQFMTYFYNKVRSYTRVQQLKYYKRFHLINASPYDETFKPDESQEA